MAYGYAIKIAGATYESVPEIKMVDADTGDKVGYYPYINGLATVEQSGGVAGIGIRTRVSDDDVIVMKASELHKLLLQQVAFVTMYDIMDAAGKSVSVFGFQEQTYTGGFGVGRFADFV
jgi:hypothetical protein